MKFELTMPPSGGADRSAIVVVEAPNWVAALSRALDRVGAAQIPKGKAVAEVKADGTIAVRNAANGEVFFIRPVPAGSTRLDHPVQPAASSPPGTQPQVESPEPPQYHPTMTYLDAEVARQVGRTPTSGPPARLIETPPVSVRSPCLIIPRIEIERRLKEAGISPDIQDVARAPAETQSRGEEVPVWGQEQPVQMVHVVDVEVPARDTLTTLKVDLDALRDAASRQGSGKSVGSAPEGFEWLAGALQSALHGSRNAREIGERTLRLALAAVPSGAAAYLIRNPRSGVTSAIAAIGDETRCLAGRAIIASIGPVSACISGCLSMAMEAAAVEPYSLSMLSSETGLTLRNALLASLTNGRTSIGVLLLGNSLAKPAYSTLDLAVAAYTAAFSFVELQRLEAGSK